MKKTLPTLRVDEGTISRMKSAIKIYNDKSLVEMSLQEFRRLSYEYLSQIILRGDPLPFKLTQV